MQEFQTREERRDELKQQIALAATKLLEDPEQHLRELNSLVQLARDCDEYVRGPCSGPFCCVPSR